MIFGNGLIVKNIYPNPPTDLSASSISSSSVVITFTKPATPINGYYVYNNGVPISSFVVDSSSITLSGLTPISSYLITIASYNKDGISAKSASLSFTTLLSPPSSLYALLNNSTSANIYITSASGQTTSSFYYYADPSINGFNSPTKYGVITASGSITTLSVSGLIANTSYKFYVASNNSSVTSNYSNFSINNSSQIIKSTTGTVTANNNYSIITFTNTGINTVELDVSCSCNFLLVAGGGAGGNGSWSGGGGGAGGYMLGSTNLSATTYTVTVGDGGTGGTLRNVKDASNNGKDTSFNTYIVKGGGFGGSADNIRGANGGSGGGGGHGIGSGTGTDGQGFGGGTGINPGFFDSSFCGGGGGGAGSIGGNGTSTKQGAGGFGITIDSTNLTGFNKSIKVCAGGCSNFFYDASGIDSNTYTGGSGAVATTANIASDTSGNIINGSVFGIGGQGALNTTNRLVKPATSGIANTGSGGGGTGNFLRENSGNLFSGTSGSGGSGIAIFVLSSSTSTSASTSQVPSNFSYSAITSTTAVFSISAPSSGAVPTSYYYYATPGISGYTSDTSYGTIAYAGTTTTVSLGNLTSGTIYTLYVASYNITGRSNFASSTMTTMTTPLAVSYLHPYSITSSSATFVIYSPETGSIPTSYYYYSSAGISGYTSSSAYGTIPYSGVTTTLSLYGLNSSTSYIIYVASNNNGGTSNYISKIFTTQASNLLQFTSLNKPTLFHYSFNSTDVSNNAVYNYVSGTYDLKMYKPVNLNNDNLNPASNLTTTNSTLTNNIKTTDSVYPSGSLVQYTNNISNAANYGANGFRNGTVMFSNTPISLPTTGFTISFWFKGVFKYTGDLYHDPAGILHFVPSTTGSGTGKPGANSYLSIFYKSSPDIKNPQIIVIQLGNKNIYGNLDSSIVNFANGDWHFMALRFNSESVDIFVDNIWSKRIPFTTPRLPTADTLLNITSGYNYTNWESEYWAINFKHLFGWNTALSDTDIQSLYAINYTSPTLIPTFAGTYNTSGTTTGNGILLTDAKFNSPFQLAYNSKNKFLYVANYGSTTINAIDLSANLVYTMPFTSTNSTTGIALDASQNITFISSINSISTSLKTGIYDLSYSTSLISPGYIFDSTNSSFALCVDNSQNLIMANRFTKMVTYGPASGGWGSSFSNKYTYTYLDASFNSNADGIFYDSLKDQVWVTSGPNVYSIYVLQNNSANPAAVRSIIYKNTNYRTTGYPLGIYINTLGSDKVVNASIMNVFIDSARNMIAVDYGNSFIYKITPGSDQQYGLFPGSATPTFSLLVGNHNSAIFKTTQINGPFHFIIAGNDAYFTQRGGQVISKISNYTSMM